MRYAAGVALIVGGYYAATKAGEALLLQPGNVGVVWLATGVGVAVLYLGGWRWWPGVLLGDLLALNWASLPLGTALGESVANMAEILLAVAILQRLAGRRATMDRLADVGAVLVAAVTGAAAGATVAMLSMWAGDVVGVSDLGEFWRNWWLADAGGGLVVVPLALAWAHPRGLALRGRGAVEGALTLASVAGLTAIAFSGDDPLTYVVFPALIWSALRFGPQGATMALAAATAIAVWATANEAGPFLKQVATHTALNLQLYIAVAAVTTLCLAAIVSERRRATLDLAESKRREGERAALERQRIARDLHDSVSQSLFSTMLHVGSAQRALAQDGLDSTESVEEELREISQLTQDALSEMRALIFELRPDALADEGLVAALTVQASALGVREGLVIEVDGPAERLPLGAEVEEQLYRLGQEALANVVKHARATNASIRIVPRDGIVSLEVRDDGRGFDPAAVSGGHFGLRSMRGRVADLDGRLEIRSAPGHGTVLRVEVPAKR